MEKKFFKPLMESVDTFLKSIWESPFINGISKSIKDIYLWFHRFSEYSDEIMFIFFLLLSITGTLLILRAVNKDKLFMGWKYHLNWIIFIASSLVQIFYVLSMGADALWFCDHEKVGWFWMVINFLFFGATLFLQLNIFKYTLFDVQYNSNISVSLHLGIFSWPVFIFLSSFSVFIYPPAFLIVFLLFILAQIIQMIMIFKTTFRNKEYSNGVIFYLVFIIGSLSLLSLFVQFVIMVAIVFAVIIGITLGLSMFAGSEEEDRYFRYWW